MLAKKLNDFVIDSFFSQSNRRVDQRMMLKELAEKTGIAVNNSSILKTRKAHAIRFSTLESVFEALNCTPGDLLEYVPEKKEEG